MFMLQLHLPNQLALHPFPPGFQTAKQSHLITNVVHQISELERLLHSFHNQTQMRLITIETQLDAIQQKLEESL